MQAAWRLSSGPPLGPGLPVHAHTALATHHRFWLLVASQGPVTAAPPEVLEDMERCARALARSVGYVGAGELAGAASCCGPAGRACPSCVRGPAVHACNRRSYKPRPHLLACHLSVPVQPRLSSCTSWRRRNTASWSSTPACRWGGCSRMWWAASQHPPPVAGRAVHSC